MWLVLARPNVPKEKSHQYHRVKTGGTLLTLAVSQIRDWVLQGMLSTEACPSQESMVVTAELWSYYYLCGLCKGFFCLCDVFAVTIWRQISGNHDIFTWYFLIRQFDKEHLSEYLTTAEVCDLFSLKMCTWEMIMWSRTECITTTVSFDTWKNIQAATLTYCSMAIKTKINWYTVGELICVYCCS